MRFVKGLAGHLARFNLFVTIRCRAVTGLSQFVARKNFAPLLVPAVSMKQRVLFICIHNSARSQMAEAWLNKICGEFFEAQSAGIEPGVLNPLVIEVMREVEIDISQKKTQSVFDVLKSGVPFDYTVTVCDEASAEKCPIFPGVAKRLHWGFPDPSVLAGTRGEKLEKIRVIRDTIKTRVENWCAEMCGAARSEKAQP